MASAIYLSRLSNKNAWAGKKCTVVEARSHSFRSSQRGLPVKTADLTKSEIITMGSVRKENNLDKIWKTIQGLQAFFAGL